MDAGIRDCGHVCAGRAIESIEIFKGYRIFRPCIGFGKFLISIEFATVKFAGVVIDSPGCSERTGLGALPLSFRVRFTHVSIQINRGEI